MRKLLCMLIPAVLALVSCTPSPDGPRHVNIISIGFDYDGTGYALPYGPEQDGEAMARQLAFLAEGSGYAYDLFHYQSDGGAIVSSSTGESLSNEQMIREIESIEAGSDDLNIFFFSGHGTSSEDSSYILLMDNTIWGLDNIAEMLGYIGGKSLMIIDACNSGTQSPNDVGSGETFDEDGYFEGIDIGTAISDAFSASFSARSYGPVYILAACTPGQYSYAGSKEDPYSVMTGVMLGYLGFDTKSSETGFPEDSTVTFTELYKGISEGLERIYYSNGLSYYDVQTPQPSRVPTDLLLFSL